MRGGILALALLTGAAWLQAQNLAGVRHCGRREHQFAPALRRDRFGHGKQRVRPVGRWNIDKPDLTGPGQRPHRCGVISGRLAVKRDGNVWQWGQHLDPQLVPQSSQGAGASSGLTEIVAAAEVRRTVWP